MSVHPDLRSLSARALCERLDTLVADERELLCQFLCHLAELERRQLHLELGFSSVFAYLRDHHRMAKATAYRRMTAARLVSRVPAALEALRSGALCLTTLCALRDVLTPEHAPQLLERAAGMSEADVEMLVATLRPAAPPRDTVRRLPSRKAAPLPLDPGSPPPPDAAGAMHGATPGASPVDHAPEAPATDGAAGAPASPQPSGARAALARPAQLSPVAQDLRVLRMTVDAAFFAQLEEARMLLSHVVPSGELTEVLRQCVRIAVETKRRQRRGGQQRGDAKSTRAAEDRSTLPRAASPTPEDDAPPVAAPDTPAQDDARGSGAEPPRSRYVPVSLRRAIWQRDQGRCTSVGDNGRRCNATHQLEIHHDQAFARGGRHELDSCRLLCRPHNLLMAERDFGAAHMAKFREPLATRHGAPLRPRDP